MARQNLNPYGQSFNQTDYNNSSPLEVIIETPAPQTLYCVKCKRLIFERILSYKTLKNGVRAVTSIHHVCGTLMYKFVNKEGE
jgi:hypothetical protein